MFVVPVSRNSSELARNFERLFDGNFDRLFARTPETCSDATRSPALDVAESAIAYTVKLDLPGVTKEEVKVAIDGRRVSVAAQARKEESKSEDDRIVYRERSMSSYARSFTVAAEVDQAESTAKLENGVLTLTLNKRHPPVAKQLTVA